MGYRHFLSQAVRTPSGDLPDTSLDLTGLRFNEHKILAIHEFFRRVTLKNVVGVRISEKLKGIIDRSSFVTAAGELPASGELALRSSGPDLPTLPSARFLRYRCTNVWCRHRTFFVSEPGSGVSCPSCGEPMTPGLSQ